MCKKIDFEYKRHGHVYVIIPITKQAIDLYNREIFNGRDPSHHYITFLEWKAFKAALRKAGYTMRKMRAVKANANPQFTRDDEALLQELGL